MKNGQTYRPRAILTTPELEIEVLLLQDLLQAADELSCHTFKRHDLIHMLNNLVIFYKDDDLVEICTKLLLGQAATQDNNPPKVAIVHLRNVPKVMKKTRFELNSQISRLAAEL